MKITLLSIVLLAATPALAQTTSVGKTPQGAPYLQDSGAAALYVFDNDKTTGGTPGAPTCNGQCATVWPPFLAKADASPHGDWGLATRQDGAKQWTYKGRPLYTFVRDQKEGKIEGDGFNGNKWHLAKP